MAVWKEASVRSEGFMNRSPSTLPASARRCGLSLQGLREREQIEDLRALEIGQIQEALHAEIVARRRAQLVDVPFVHDVGRQQPKHVRIAAGAGQNSLLHQRRLHFLGGTRGLQPEEQSRALNTRDRPHQTVRADVVGHLPHVGEERFGFDHVDHRLDRRAGHGTAAESRAHVVILDPLGDTLREHERGNREAVAQGFRRSDDIRA